MSIVCRYFLPDNPSREFRLASIVSACAARRAKSGDVEWFASTDRSQALEHALALSENDEQAAELLLEWGERTADVLVARHQSKVEKLRQILSERGRPSGAEVREIIEHAGDATKVEPLTAVAA